MPAPIRVLLVDDEEDALLVTKVRLERQPRGRYTVDWACTYEAGLEALASGRYDVALVDLDLHETQSGLDLTRAAILAGCVTPVVILTACEDGSVEAAALAAGATDYLFKSEVDGHALGRALRHAVERTAALHALRQKESEARTLRERMAVADRLATAGTLAAGVAHEINNPLAAVVANLEIAAEELTRVVADNDDPVMSRVIDVLADARVASSRVATIVRDLQLFARSDEGRTAPVDVRRVVAGALKVAAHEIRHRARVVEEHVDGAVVSANESHLGQVVLNLLRNAAQALPEGHADEHEVRVTTRVVDGRVCLAIADTGSGIAPEHLERIFEPFYTTRPAGLATGLGLAVCHGIVRSLSGEILVHTEVGRGTRVEVWLPAALQRALPREDTPIPRARRATILLVDDDPIVLKALTVALRRRHEVTALTDATAAVTLLEQGARFDVILSDLMMPVLSGPGFFEEVRRRAPGYEKRIIFMTGGAFTSEAAAFLRRVPNHNIEKPVDFRRLEALITSHVP